MKMSILIVSVLIGACHAVSEVEPKWPQRQQVDEEQAAFMARQKKLQEEEEELDRRKAAYNPSANIVYRQPCPQCEAKRAELEAIRAQLLAEQSLQRDCTMIAKSQTRVYDWGQRRTIGPQVAWLCNGQMVDSPETTKTQHLAVSQGNLIHWIKENCDNVSEQSVVVGEHYCGD